jgi:hypothetical protein
VQGTLLTIPEARGSFRLRLVLGPTGPDEAESDVFTWVGPAQGAFATEGNWEGETGAPGVPGFVSFEDADTAIVDSASPVTVDLAASGLSRALVPRGLLPERRTGRLQVLQSDTWRPVGALSCWTRSLRSSSTVPRGRRGRDAAPRRGRRGRAT